jgi:hypothetical protein
MTESSGEAALRVLTWVGVTVFSYLLQLPCSVHDTLALRASSIASFQACRRLHVIPLSWRRCSWLFSFTLPPLRWFCTQGGFSAHRLLDCWQRCVMSWRLVRIAVEPMRDREPLFFGEFEHWENSIRLSFENMIMAMKPEWTRCRRSLVHADIIRLLRIARHFAGESSRVHARTGPTRGQGTATLGPYPLEVTFALDGFVTELWGVGAVVGCLPPLTFAALPAPVHLSSETLGWDTIGVGC